MIYYKLVVIIGWFLLITSTFFFPFSSEQFGCGQIKQCKNGHPICGTCAIKMSQKNECPQCRSSLDCRSLLLEKILLVLPRPCIFAQLGCKKVLKPNNEAELQHELNCKHGKYPCPFCKTKIVIGQPLNEHVMKKHNYQTESDRNSNNLINRFSFSPMLCRTEF